MTSAITPHIRGGMALPPGRMRSAARSGSTSGMVPASSAAVSAKQAQNFLQMPGRFFLQMPGSENGRSVSSSLAGMADSIQVPGLMSAPSF